MPVISDPDKTLETAVGMINDKIARMMSDLQSKYFVPETERDQAAIAVLHYKIEILRNAVNLINLA